MALARLSRIETSTAPWLAYAGGSEPENRERKSPRAGQLLLKVNEAAEPLERLKQSRNRG